MVPEEEQEIQPVEASRRGEGLKGGHAEYDEGGHLARRGTMRPVLKGDFDF